MDTRHFDYRVRRPSEHGERRRDRLRPNRLQTQARPRRGARLGNYSIRLEGIWVVSQSARPAATGDGPAPFAEQRARRRHRAPAKSLSPTHGHFVGVSRKRPASALTQTEGAAEVSPPFVKPMNPR